LRLVASRDGRDGSLRIHQDAAVYASLLDAEDTVEYALERSRRAYVHVVRGTARVNGQALSAGDAVKISGEQRVSIDQPAAAEILLFDLP
jgi:quercetin 2,3-dioxygenase